VRDGDPTCGVDLAGRRDVSRHCGSPTALVPIGSTEHHGPHLPLGVDTHEAADVAAAAVSARTGVPVAPAIPHGDADHHLAIPGTVSLPTVVSVLTDVHESLLGHGFETVLTVNGHRIATLAAIDARDDGSRTAERAVRSR
jgi:creatinine amidohydrolase